MPCGYLLARLRDVTGGDLESAVTIYEIADAINLPREQALIAVKHLKDRGLVRFYPKPGQISRETGKPYGDGDGDLFITAQGVEHIERYELPFWKFMFTDRGLRATLIISIVSAVVSAVVVAWLSKLWK